MPKLLPHMHLKNFLSDELSLEIFSYAVDNKEKYIASRVGSKEGGRVNEQARVSLVLRDLGPFASVVQRKIHDFYPNMLAGLKMSDFKVREEIELELAAHGDGAFYKPHIDTRLGETANRVLSAVYYLHSRPKVFRGGRLRIYPVDILPGDDLPVEIEPTHNSLLVFPSYVRHEVLPVACPRAEFADHRFAVNCWIHKSTH